MILVFAHSYDSSAKNVLHWLAYYGCNFICTAGSEFSIDTIKISSDKVSVNLICHNKKILLDDITSVWYRSEWVRVKDYFSDNSLFSKNKNFKKSVYAFLSDYWYAIRETIVLMLSMKNNLGADNLGRYNKPIALFEAKKAGMSVPNTIVTGDKKELLDFFFTNDSKIITKAYDMGFSSHEENEIFLEYTSTVSEDQIKKMPTTFKPTLFQESIDKQYEIRVFFLNGECYSTAIFSQNNLKTRVDYRRYDQEKMNRCVPYELPHSVEQSVLDFMKACNLKTGSIDIIKARDGRYVFLEVNPVGQFGALSAYSNYNLHKKVAEYLMK